VTSRSNITFCTATWATAVRAYGADSPTLRQRARKGNKEGLKTNSHSACGSRRLSFFS
jgi:hypothetical protein